MVNANYAALCTWRKALVTPAFSSKTLKLLKIDRPSERRSRTHRKATRSPEVATLYTQHFTRASLHGAARDVTAAKAIELGSWAGDRPLIAMVRSDRLTPKRWLTLGRLAIYSAKRIASGSSYCRLLAFTNFHVTLLRRGCPPWYWNSILCQRGWIEKLPSSHKKIKIVRLSENTKRFDGLATM